jgi:hypothetical protein
MVLGPRRVVQCVFVCVRARARACACNERVRAMSVAFVSVLFCLFVFICVRPCVCACVRARVPVCTHVRGFVRLHQIEFSRACVCPTCLCAANACARPPIARRRLAVSIARPRRASAAARAWLRSVPSAGLARASAAGVTWTSRTASAGWEARKYHTSVIDAAGAILVIGGYDGGNFNDVWASTDGGAPPDSV